MQQAIGWVIVIAIVLGIWQLRRALRRSFRRISDQRAEAFSNAVSQAVQQGVQAAISAAIADANATATGGNVSVHIGDNLARFIADNYDGRDDDDRSADNYDNVAALHEPTDRRSVGDVPHSARRGELASGRVIRPSNTDSTGRRNIHKPIVRGGDVG